MNALTLRRGSMFVSGECYARCFSGAQGVILMRDQENLHVIPVAAGGVGGYILKQVSAAGDRVIHAGPFLYENGVDDAERIVDAAWDDEAGQLVIRGIFSPAKENEEYK